MRFQMIYADDEKEDVTKYATALAKIFPNHKLKPGRTKRKNNHLYFDEVKSKKHG